MFFFSDLQQVIGLIFKNPQFPRAVETLGLKKSPLSAKSYLLLHAETERIPFKIALVSNQVPKTPKIVATRFIFSANFSP